MTVEADPVTQDIGLTLFPGLKLTVKVSPSSSEFILPVTYAALLANRPEIDLNIDWGDGTGSGLDTAPASTAEADYTHNYADALGAETEQEFTLRITGKCFWMTSADSKVAFNFHGSPSTEPGDPSTLEGFLAAGNRNKILKAAGNITALTGGRTRAFLNHNAYRGLFYACENLEDVSGLVFTDDLDGTESFFMAYAFSKTKITGFPVFPDVTQGSDSFLSHTFEGCTNITRIPEFLANIASLDAYAGAFLDYAFAGTGITELPADFLANITDPGHYFLRGTFKGCSNLTTTNNGFIAKAVPGAAITGFLNNTFEDCTNLSYIDIGAQTTSDVSDPNDRGQMQLLIHAFANVGTASAEGVTIRIHYTGKAVILRPNDAYNDETFGLDTAKVKEIQMPRDLLEDYQNDTYWGGEIGVNDTAKIVPLQD